MRKRLEVLLGEKEAGGLILGKLNLEAVLLQIARIIPGKSTTLTVAAQVRFMRHAFDIFDDTVISLDCRIISLFPMQRTGELVRRRVESANISIQ